MTTLAFPHPAVRHALLQDLAPDQAAGAFLAALRATRYTGAHRLAEPLLLAFRLLDEMVQENLAFALLETIQQGHPLDGGLDLEWRWNLWHLLGVLIVCRDTPNDLESPAELALLEAFRKAPDTLHELIGLLQAVAETPTVWPGINLDVSPANPVALARPLPGQPFWQHLVFELTACRRQQAPQTAGSHQRMMRLEKALETIRNVEHRPVEAALPKPPTMAGAQVVYLHHRR